MIVEESMARGIVALIADISIRTALVIVAAGLWTVLHRSASAGVRHMVWTLALLASVALPVLVPWAPAWRVAVPLPERAEHAGTVSLSSDAAVAGPRTLPAPVPVGAPAVVERIAGDTEPAAPASFGGGIASILLLVWVAGVIAVATPVLRASVRLRRLERSTVPVRSRAVRGAFGQIASGLRIRRPVLLVAGPAGCMPMTWGIRRPVVLVPADAWKWPAGRLHAVLRHELAHVARRDALTHAAGELACVLHWFNPLVWLAAKRQREEREHACDDRVLSSGSSREDYAADLIDLARSLRIGRAAAAGGMAMARGRSLRSRLIAVLDERRDRRPVTARHLCRAIGGSALFVLALACVSPSRAESAPAPRAESASAPRAESAPALRAESVSALRAESASAPRAESASVLRAELAPAAPPAPSVRELPPASPLPVGKPGPVARPSQAFAPPVPQTGQADPGLTVLVLRQAAAKLGDRELTGLLDAALEMGAIGDEATRAAFLEAVASIGSDRNRADLLVTYAHLRPLTDEERTRVLEVLEGVGSDRDRRRVLEALAGR